jgi:CHAD domain-containing protein
MPAALPRDLLQRPAQEAARRVALRRLDEAVAAAPRLAEAQDGEALHDFRVALRRLRSALRALRPLLEEAVPKPERRRLRRLAEATGAARDAEVAAAWLRCAEPTLIDGARPAAKRLAAWLGERAEEGYGEARRAAEKFPRLAERLRRRLASYQIEEPGNDGNRFGAAAAGLLREHAMALAEALDEVEGAASETEIHRARIAGKRLRYFLEPLQAVAPRAKPLLERLKSFQDAAGQLHDGHVLATILRREAKRLGTGRGRMALARALKRAQEERFAELEAGWLRGRAGPFLEEVEELAVRLERGGGPR